MEPGLTLRALNIDDLPTAAQVHRAAFPHSALTCLGQEAVHRYYRWLLTGPHEVTALGAFQGDYLVGFLFGGRFRGSLSGFLQRNRGFLLWTTLTHPWLLANPEFRQRLGTGLRVLRRSFLSRPPAPTGKNPAPGAAAASPIPNHPPLSFGILSIAVHPNCQGKGAGKLLVREAEAIARRLGYPHMHLTVEPHNHQAIRFYEAIGWEKGRGNGVMQEVNWTGHMEKQLLEHETGE